jgi:anti-sigma regulatory factor (Ser/Thr protein kinase)
MPDGLTPKAEARLSLNSRLAKLALVRPWVDVLAAEHHIPEEKVFAINLCLEEALSNVIRHGYLGERDHRLTIDFSVDADGELVFTIEDDAPRFNSSEFKERPAAASADEIKPGGQGIRLMRKFANSLAWEPLPHGNRLTLGFHYGAPGGEPR